MPFVTIDRRVDVLAPRPQPVTPTPVEDGAEEALRRRARERAWLSTLRCQQSEDMPVPVATAPPQPAAIFPLEADYRMPRPASMIAPRSRQDDFGLVPQPSLPIPGPFADERQSRSSGLRHPLGRRTQRDDDPFVFPPKIGLFLPDERGGTMGLPPALLKLLRSRQWPADNEGLSQPFIPQALYIRVVFNPSYIISVDFKPTYRIDVNILPPT